MAAETMRSLRRMEKRALLPMLLRMMIKKKTSSSFLSWMMIIMR